MRTATYLLLIAVLSLFNIKVSAIAVSVKGYVSVVHEASGIDFTGGSSFWTHNDGYGDNRLYKISSTGSRLRTVTVTNATNNDWEDLTSDKDKDYLYIGDFGNNGCNRSNLRIYKIPHPSSFSSSSVIAQKIKFSYPDQTTLHHSWMNFDVEGFFHHNGKLFLFTKADGDAIGYTKLYTLPDDPGNYVATFIDSFPISGRITSADISPDGRKAVLMSRTQLYIFKNFYGDNVFNGQYIKLNLDCSNTQKEGMCFYSSDKICIIDEGSSSKLYSVDLDYYLRLESDLPYVEPIADKIGFNAKVYPNPASEFVVCQATGDFPECEIQLTDMSGKIIRRIFVLPDAEARIDLYDLSSGIYFVNSIAGQEKRSIRLVVNH